MFSFLFRGATYYILWQKFQKQIILIILSIIAISVIMGIYDDLFKVLKVSNKDSLVGLLLFKWFIISCIVGFNIYKLKQIKLEDKEKVEIFEKPQVEENQDIPQQSKEILKKKKLLSTTDVILNKYIYK